MSKKTATILIILLILLVGGGFVGFYLYINPGGEGGGTTPGTTDRPDLFPFPSPSPSGSNGNNGNTGNQGTNGQQTQIGKLRRISDEPVAGISFLQKESISLIHYLERRTVPRTYEVDVASLRKNRLASTNIPKVIYEGTWVENGNGIIMRYLKDDNMSIESYYARLVDPKESTSSPKTPGVGTTAETDIQAIEGVFLPVNIVSLSPSPKRDKIFYISTGLNGSVGTIANPDGTKKVQVFDSPLREWTSQWAKEDTIVLATKASGVVTGHLYFLNTRTNSVTPIISGVLGLTGLASTDAQKILYSGALQTGLSTSLFDIKTGQAKAFESNTLPEKCVWSAKNVQTVFCAVPKNIPVGLYPDDWYMGKIGFDDTIVMINTSTGESKDVMNLSQVALQEIDAIDLSLDQQEKSLLFRNKKDLSAWVLTLE